MSADYLLALSKLRVGRVGDHVRPHKPSLLLAVLDLAEAGRLVENKIRYDAPLLEAFHRYFTVVRSAKDAENPYLPFYYLTGDKFWHLQAKPEQTTALKSMRPNHAGMLNKVVDYAYLDECLFNMLQQPTWRKRIRELLVETYFQRDDAELRKLFNQERKILNYEKSLKESVESGGRVKEDVPAESKIRDAAFGRVVKEAYDYRCAASGLRLIVQGNSLVEAAHIIPWSESHDDDPRNGLALSRNHHWAMDQNILVPGPDFKWHVSPVLDRRVRDFHEIADLDGKELLLPHDPRYHPRKDALGWRMRMLQK